MLYKIDCTAAREAAARRAGPVSPVFKMKRTREEFRIARKLLEENALALKEGDAEQVLTSEDAVQCAHDMIKTETDVTKLGVLNNADNDGDIEDGMIIKNIETIEQLEVTSPIAYDGSAVEEEDCETLVEDNKDRRRSDPPAYVVSHPWQIVDYHLYLCSAERGQTLEARREGMYLFDGVDCRRLPYDEFAVDRSLMSLCQSGDQIELLFGILPIADRRHFTDRTPSFDGRHYVLGFDYDSKALYARHFDWFPHDITDIWCIWQEGVDMYTVTVPDLIHIMETSISRGEVHVGMGVLSSSQYCSTLGANDDPGLEIVIATLWCQWLLDFSEVLFQQDTPRLCSFQASLGHYVEQGRLILQRASYRAWFAVRDGYSKEQYKWKTTVNQYTNDLYTFEKSAEDGSLKDRAWTAPGLQTCNQIRHNERMQRKKHVERRLEDLFVAPESQATETTGSQEAVLQSMLARAQPSSVDFNALDPDNIPRTPSPKTQQDTPALLERYIDPGSPEIVIPAAEPYDEFEAATYHYIPLPTLLQRALELVQAYPELDTFVNRGQFGDLLADLGIEIQRPVLGYDNRRWKFDQLLEQENRVRLLPSPTLR